MTSNTSLQLTVMWRALQTHCIMQFTMATRAASPLDGQMKDQSSNFMIRRNNMLVLWAIQCNRQLPPPRDAASTPGMPAGC